MLAVVDARVIGSPQARGVRVLDARRLPRALRREVTAPLSPDRVGQLHQAARDPGTWTQTLRGARR